MKKVFIILLLFSCSCSQYKGYMRVPFTLTGTNKKVMVINMPRHASVKILLAGGEIGETRLYSFADSSVIYMYIGRGTVDDSLVRSLGGWAPSKQLSCDTATFCSVDANGKYWKKIKYVEVVYGYHNVKRERLQEFETAIKSVKRKVNYKITRLPEFCLCTNREFIAE